MKTTIIGKFSAAKSAYRYLNFITLTLYWDDFRKLFPSFHFYLTFVLGLLKTSLICTKVQLFAVCCVVSCLLAWVRHLFVLWLMKQYLFWFSTDFLKFVLSIKIFSRQSNYQNIYATKKTKNPNVILVEELIVYVMKK